jgi:hypothetical protein
MGESRLAGGLASDFLTRPVPSETHVQSSSFSRPQVLFEALKVSLEITKRVLKTV